MRTSGSKLGLLFLPSMATLGLLALVWAVTAGSSQAQQDAMQNCPEPDKWAISVWDGPEDVPTGDALATCGEGAVSAAYALDPDSQSWSRYFHGHPEISDLDILHPGQAVIALAANVSAAGPTPDGPEETPAARMMGCPQFGRWAISAWPGPSGTPIDQAVRNCMGAEIAEAYWIDPETQAWKRYFAGHPEVSDLTTLDSMQAIITYGGVPSYDASLTVHFIDVGQGDATLIEAHDATILVDGGEASANVAEYLRAQGIQDLDLVVATHPHADHIGGLVDVLSQFNVREIWTNGDTADTQTYSSFAAAVANEQAAGAVVRKVSWGYDATFDGADLEVLNPTTSLSGDANQDSLVLEVTCGWVDILMMGDATADTEAEMLSSGVLRSVEVLKVPEHGSSTSTSPAFLGRVSPDDAVISVGVRNTYGHPDQETIDRLANAGVLVHRTDEDGTIVLTSDCATYAMGAGNLAPNPSFETGVDSPEDWTLTWQTTWHDEEARRGSKAVQWQFSLEWSEELDSCSMLVTDIASERVAIDPATTYLFSFWQKSSTIGKYVSSLTGYLSLFDSQGTMLERYFSPVGAFGTEELRSEGWLKATAKIGPRESRTWPPGTTSVEIRLSNGAQGPLPDTADCQGEGLLLWADDVFLAPID
jgi:beta-lactamase superfamily II metal-dependent hydrolase